MSEERAPLQAIEEAVDQYRHAKKYGVPVGLVLMLLFGLYQFLGLKNEVEVIKKKDIPRIEEAVQSVRDDVKKIEKNVEKIEDGQTPYQVWQRAVLQSLERKLGATPVPLPLPLRHPIEEPRSPPR